MKVLFANEYYNGKINEKGYIHKMIMEYFLRYNFIITVDYDRYKNTRFYNEYPNTFVS